MSLAAQRVARGEHQRVQRRTRSCGSGAKMAAAVARGGGAEREREQRVDARGLEPSAAAI